MRTLNIIRNNIAYEFRLLEIPMIVEVFKDDKFTYIIKPKGKKMICNCPSGYYRKHCWHSEFALGIWSAEQILEPWTLWAEEAGIMQYNKGV